MNRESGALSGYCDLSTMDCSAKKIFTFVPITRTNCEDVTSHLCESLADSFL